MRSFQFCIQVIAAHVVLNAALIVGANAAPGDPIGQAIAIKNDVTAAYEQDRRKLAKDDPVRQQEIIEVGDDSLGELKFKDDTKLALGPGSRMTLDKFVYDPEKTSGSIVVNLLKGTFRFITGLAAKPSYQIKTPSASISVRGTIFDVYIKPDGSTWLLLIEGAVEVCNDASSCQLLDEPGKFIQVTQLPRKSKRASSGDGPQPARAWNISSPTKWAALPGKRSTPIETAFPFVPTAPSFDPNPWYSANDIIIGRFPRHPRHPHHPPSRGDGGGKGEGGKGEGGKGDGGRHPTPGKDGGIKTTPPRTPPVILKTERPPRVRTHHPRNDPPPKIEKPDRSKPTKVVRHRDRPVPPVIRHKPDRERVHEDRPKRRAHEDRPRRVRIERAHVERTPRKDISKPFLAKPFIAPSIGIGIGGGSFGRGGGFGNFGGGRHR